MGRWKWGLMLRFVGGRLLGESKTVKNVWLCCGDGYTMTMPTSLVWRVGFGIVRM